MINYIIKNYFLSIFLISILVVISAYIMELFFNYPPCKLCLYQRIPYFILIMLSIISYIIKPKVFFYYLAGLSILTNLLISSFHSLVERKIINYDGVCTSKINEFDYFGQATYNVATKSEWFTCVFQKPMNTYEKHFLTYDIGLRT